MGYKVINGKLHLIDDFSPYSSSSKARTIDNKKSFQQILENKLENKNFINNNSFILSNHAAERLQQRNISLNEADMKKINEGINKAEEKGCRECLIMYKDTALITSIKNRTVITAVDKESCKGNVFTNIDSVVML